VFSLHIDTSRHWTGGSSQVMYTVMGLRARREQAALVADPQGELFRRMSEGTDLIPLAPTHDIDLAASWRLSRVIRQLKPDVIHAHDPRGVTMAATALSITAPTPTPVFVASRRLESRVSHSSFARWTYAQVDGFIANSKIISDRLVTDGIPRVKISIVNEGVDVERIERLKPANVRAAFYLPMQAPIVGNVAALVPHKGQHHLIDAAAIAVRQVPDVRFVIVGDGELRHSLEEQIRHKHLERHVFLAGFRDDALELTKGFDLFVMSSTTEGMCTALVDAMAAAKAAVATDAGAIPEVMVDGETGFLVPTRDHEAMAARIVQLLKNPKLRTRMGEAALERARERFTVERMVDGTQATYESLFSAKRKVS
jgi:glycosyltransferase involved in cell wall biosynthesis